MKKTKPFRCITVLRGPEDHEKGWPRWTPQPTIWRLTVLAADANGILQFEGFVEDSPEFTCSGQSEFNRDEIQAKYGLPFVYMAWVGSLVGPIIVQALRTPAAF